MQLKTNKNKKMLMISKLIFHKRIFHKNNNKNYEITKKLGKIEQNLIDHRK